MLRAVEKDDVPRLWEFDNDLEVHMLGDDDPPVPKSLERFQADFEEYLKKPDEVIFAIEVDGKLIGSCSLYHLDATARSCELGIVIGDRGYWGRGYGREAVRLLVDYAFRHRNLHKVRLNVTADNERAIRSYRSCGFVEDGRLRDHVWVDGRYKDMIEMSLLRPEWRGVEERPS